MNDCSMQRVLYRCINLRLTVRMKDEKRKELQKCQPRSGKHRRSVSTKPE